MPHHGVTRDGITKHSGTHVRPDHSPLLGGRDWEAILYGFIVRILY